MPRATRLELVAVKPWLLPAKTLGSSSSPAAIRVLWVFRVQPGRYSKKSYEPPPKQKLTRDGASTTSSFVSSRGPATAIAMAPTGAVKTMAKTATVKTIRARSLRPTSPPRRARRRRRPPGPSPWAARRARRTSAPSASTKTRARRSTSPRSGRRPRSRSKDDAEPRVPSPYDRQVHGRP